MDLKNLDEFLSACAVDAQNKQTWCDKNSTPELTHYYAGKAEAYKDVQNTLVRMNGVYDVLYRCSNDG